MASGEQNVLHRPDEGAGQRRTMVAGETGVALVMALIVTAVVFLLIASTLYITTQSTKMSNPTYKTACQAADGAIAIMKDAIIKKVSGLSLPDNVFYLPVAGEEDFGTCMNRIKSTPGSCATTLILSGEMKESYSVDAMVTTLFGMTNAGSRLKYPPASTGNTSSLFYRIGVRVEGPKNTTCENSVVFRYVP